MIIKIYFINFVLMVLLILLGFRIFFIKKNFGNEYEKRVIKQQSNCTFDSIVQAKRGVIFDRNKKILVSSNIVYDLVLDIKNLSREKKESIDIILSELKKALDLKDKDINKLLDHNEDNKLINDTNYYLLKKRISRSKKNYLEDKKLKYVYFEEYCERNYMYDNLSPQVIGFSHGQNLYGIEKEYDKELTGVNGRIFKSFDIKKNLNIKNSGPRDGYNLITTLDIDIQNFSQEIINSAGEKYNAEYAGVIVMDPKTGEIISMAQYPSTNLSDPSNLDNLTSKNLKDKLLNLNKKDKLKKLFDIWTNFNISKTFEPGSIFKPIVVATALDQNIIDDNFISNCAGNIDIADKKIHCWKRNGHGNLDVIHILANSCNIGMINIINKLGNEQFYKYQRDFGYGDKTSIDLPDEQSAKKLIYNLNKLNSVELATCSMGQGFNNTPMQALNAFAAVINGGNLIKPHIVSQITDSDGNIVDTKTKDVMRKVISKKTSDFMREILKIVITNGTGSAAFINGYDIGGKTGTAQQGNRDKKIFTYSFVGYLTVENPEYVSIVVIYKPENKENISAASITKNIFEKIIEYKKIDNHRNCEDNNKRQI
ncbi:MAG: hypothetical protein LBJ93_01275 [Clostridiales bacterium]|nr:hypothetical protein [Clostridiales bacterium]